MVSTIKEGMGSTKSDEWAIHSLSARSASACLQAERARRAASDALRRC
jgi:hypothetical protein